MTNEIKLLRAFIEASGFEAEEVKETIRHRPYFVNCDFDVTIDYKVTMNTEKLISALSSKMKNMTDDERLHLIRSLTDGYCSECMSKYLPCHCLNDD